MTRATTAPDVVDTAERCAEPCSLRALLAYFLRLGTVGFGGPIALVGYMQRDLVERRGWISKQGYVEGLALAQLAPGPLAAQLAIYLGWIRAGTLGATLVALAFVLPSFVMVLALSALYLRYGGLAWMQGAFYGVGAAVIAIIARSAYKLVRMTVGKDRLLTALFALSAIVTAWTGSELVWIFFLCGVIALFVNAPPRRFGRTMSVLTPWPWLVNGLHGPAVGKAVPRRGGGGDDHPGARRDHRRLHWVPRCRPARREPRRTGSLPALLPLRRHPGDLLPPRRYQSERKGVRQRRDRGGNGRDCGCGLHPRSPGGEDVPTLLICLTTLLALVRVKGISEPVIILVSGVVGIAIKSTTGL